jgi:DNA-methyltransferase (dcm)
MKKYKLISLFCGAGGMDYGFHHGNFDIVWANDFDEDACKTYAENLGGNVVHGDITKIDKKTIPNCDVVIGGFPCQGFSVANNKRSMKDERNFLYKELLKVVKEKKPKVFVAENVKGLLSMENGKVIKMIVKDFEDLGYKVDYKVVLSSEYGVPQKRERVLIIGNRVGVKNIFPKKTHKENEFVTVKEAIGFLQNTKLSEKPITVKGQKIYNHIAYTNVSSKYMGRKHKVNQADICDYLKEWRQKSGWSTKRIDEYFGYAHTAGHWFRKDNKSGSIPKAKDWFKLKEILGFDDKYDIFVTEYEEKEIVFEQSLRITNWDTPSDTITATGPEIHVNKKRRLSCRECAIIQTFPMDFIFKGSMNSIYRQIGNAVPVKLGVSIATVVEEMLGVI